MHLEVIRSTDRFEALAEEWNHLLQEGASHVPFLRHEYLSTWWRTLGGGEWEQGELCIIAARDEEQSLCAIAPMFFTENLDGEPALMLLGSIEISDYLDIITRPENAGLFLEALFARLTEPDIPVWHVLDWYNILEDSPTLQFVESAARNRGWSYSQEAAP